jgi:putative ABC transport system ATP-binding protein
MFDTNGASGVRLDVAGLGKRYEAGETAIIALDDISFSAEAGSLLAVMGPSGSGKSTLLHLLGAMDRADSGTVQVGTTEVTGLRGRQRVDYRRRIGFVFQRFHLLPALNVLDNVAAPLLPQRTDFDKRGRARMLLEAVGLGGREHALPSELSGGQQQRVAIARALVNEPVLLLADEPTGNLDTHTGGAIVDLLLELRAQHGMTVVVATHDPSIAGRCERVLRLLDGQIADDVEVPHIEPSDVLQRISRIEP